MSRRHSGQSETTKNDRTVPRSGEHYYLLFERSAAGIVLVNPQGQLVHCNTAFARMLGYKSTAELLTRTWQDVLWASAVELTLIDDLKATGRSQAREIRFRQRNGRSVWLLTEANWLPWCRRAELIQITTIDVTRQKRLDARPKSVSGDLVTIHEEERRSIARELHDATSQLLAALKMNLGTIQTSAPRLGPVAKRSLARCFALTQECSRQVRSLSHLLHPPVLEKFGLWKALRSYVHYFGKTSGLSIQLAIGEDLEQRRLPRTHELTLYRIVQAALMNVHLHSSSKQTSIDLFQNRDQIVLRIKDSGRGISPKVLRTLGAADAVPQGIGILGMRERVAQLGGEFRVETSARGATVTAVLPKPRRVRVVEVMQSKESSLKSA